MSPGENLHVPPYLLLIKKDTKNHTVKNNDKIDIR